jgi:hypothetical protein
MSLPGLNVPIQYLPTPRFQHAIADMVNTEPITVREIRMLDFVNQITEKPNWESKVFEQTIVAKWKEEASQTIKIGDFDDVVLSEEMFDLVSFRQYPVSKCV